MSVPKIILGKKETTYAVDATPTAAANAILTRNYKETPIEVDQLDRNLDLASRGRTQSAPTSARGTRSFEVEIAGSGTAGTAAPFMELLECCGMEAPVLTATTDAKQKFAAFGTLLSSMTFYDLVGTNLAKGLGSRGSFAWNFTVGAYPFFTFNFTSLLPAAGAIDQGTLLAPTLTRWKTPVEVNVDNTDVTLGGYVVKMQSFAGDVGAQIKLKNLTGERYVLRGNHAITGTLRVKCPNLSTKNYWTNLKAGDHLTFVLNHGTIAGNIVQFKTDYLQVLQIAVSEDDDDLFIDISYGMNVVVGQDDLLITVK